MKEMSIAQHAIKINSNGLYSLNDLHKATGDALDRNRPTEFLRRDTTVALITEIEKSNCGSEPQLAIESKAGRYGGTFVCKELVYAYAMFVSAEFNLKVIRAFDASDKMTSSTNNLVEAVRSHSRAISKDIDATTSTLAELKSHGSNWSAYGAAIKKAKKDTYDELKKLQNEIQMKLDFLG